VKEFVMAMKKGDKFECTNSECGCEINVTKASKAPNASRSPRCCCGEEMMLPKESMKGASAGAGRSQDREEFSR